MKVKQTVVPGLKLKLPEISCLKALVVDDYRPAKQLLGDSLSTIPQIGEIDFASCGEEALLKIVSKHYDLIYLDVTMPGLNGFETCERIRETRGYELTPIVIVTGDNVPGNEFKGMVSGCTKYITKPIQQTLFRKLSLDIIASL